MFSMCSFLREGEGCLAGERGRGREGKRGSMREDELGGAATRRIKVPRFECLYNYAFAFTDLRPPAGRADALGSALCGVLSVYDPNRRGGGGRI